MRKPGDRNDHPPQRFTVAFGVFEQYLLYPVSPSLGDMRRDQGECREKVHRDVCWVSLVSPDAVSHEVTFLSEKRSKQDSGFWTRHKAPWVARPLSTRSEEHTSELQSLRHLV